jgi:hypothetical protein
VIPIENGFEEDMNRLSDLGSLPFTFVDQSRTVGLTLKAIVEGASGTWIRATESSGHFRDSPWQSFLEMIEVVRKDWNRDNVDPAVGGSFDLDSRR